MSNVISSPEVRATSTVNTGYYMLIPAKDLGSVSSVMEMKNPRLREEPRVRRDRRLAGRGQSFMQEVDDSFGAGDGLDRGNGQRGGVGAGA